MAWKDLMQDASFRGVKFDCIRISDAAPRATAEHESPYLDGADIEDMGRKARRITASAIFFGDDYETRLQAFMQALDKSGSGELIHPVFGSIKDVQLLDVTIAHDADDVDSCTVELSFAESTPGNPFFVQQLPAQKAEAVNQLAESSRFNGIEAFSTAVAGLQAAKNSLSRINALRDVLTGTLGGIRSQVQGFIGTTLDLINYPRAFASDLTSLLSGMVDLRSFDSGVLMSDWKGLSEQLDSVVLLPAKVSAGNTSASGVGSASVSSAAHADDVAKVSALVRLANATAKADAASSILASEADAPTLSPTEIEHITNDARTSLQQAIDSHRSLYPLETSRPITEPLKDTSLAVQSAALSLIEIRPPLVTRVVDAPGNLHLIAFRWYGDYSRANELARLNPTLTNPNMLQRGDRLYAYAR